MLYGDQNRPRLLRRSCKLSLAVCACDCNVMIDDCCSCACACVYLTARGAAAERGNVAVKDFVEDPEDFIQYKAAVLASYQRLVSVSPRKNCQRLGLVTVSGGKRLGLVSVSAIYVSCPRPFFCQIVQATLRSVNWL